MILTTTNSVEGHTISAYKGIVVGEAIMGATIVRDFFASVPDVIGGPFSRVIRSATPAGAAG